MLYSLDVEKIHNVDKSLYIHKFFWRYSQTPICAKSFFIVDNLSIAIDMPSLTRKENKLAFQDEVIHSMKINCE